MQVIFPCCAGLDVHKRTVVACRVRTHPEGRVERQIRTFPTMTEDLLRLLDWLQEWGCTHVVLESTGEYWRPVYNLLEGSLQVWLVNARHVKNVPGRKTDVKDAEWLAELLRHGLLRPRFVPPRPQRELRDLTRLRSKLSGERASTTNRLQKVLEDANLKLACVAPDVTGVSARRMLEAMIAGEGEPTVLAELAKGRLRNKREALLAALTGRVQAHHRFLLAQHLEHLDFLEEQIGALTEQIQQQIARLSPPAAPAPAPAPPPELPEGPRAAADPGCTPPTAEPRPDSGPLAYAAAGSLLDPVPGIGVQSAETILAEIGTDMARFPTDGHLTAWAGVAPGNRESAGKRYSGKTTPGNPALRKALVQAAHGALKVKGCYFGALYRRLVGRRGKKRAIVAVARALLVVIYHMLKTGRPYYELGDDYFDRLDRQGTTNRLVSRLEQLGYQVQLAPRPALAA